MGGYVWQDGHAETEPIYRITSLHHYLDDLRSGQTRLASPHRWDDPLDDPISWMAFEELDATGHVSQTPAQSVLPPVYAQSWSATQESDALWRAYSHETAKGSGEFDAVQLRSTPARLLGALQASVPDPDRGFVGWARYEHPDQVAQAIVDRADAAGYLSFIDLRSSGRLPRCSSAAPSSTSPRCA